MFRFTIRDLMWLMVVAAVAVMGVVCNQRLSRENRLTYRKYYQEREAREKAQIELELRELGRHPK